MKKRMALLLALLLLLALAACGREKAQQQSVQLANPWTDVSSAAEAAAGAGVGTFTLPDAGSVTSAGGVNWAGWRWMKGLAQADGSIGAAELTVRKGLKLDSGDVSGDYTAYKVGWTQEVGEQMVYCYGNEEGKAMKAVWDTDEFSYSIVVRGQGDDSAAYGVAEDVVYALVTLVD